uniref:LigA n=1 Tax=Parastrongyloides trichosuri TaxID=131310 RepID=A0A0N4ZIW7_PARTI
MRGRPLKSSLLDELRAQDQAAHLFDVGLDFVGVAGQADVLDHGAALQRHPARALDLQILDQGHAVAVRQDVAVGVLGDVVAHDRRPARPPAGRPASARRRVAPGLMRQIGDLGRLQAEAADVEQEEVVQRIGADDALRRLDRPVGARRHQLGRDLGGQNGVQGRRRRLAHQLTLGHPADQVLDQGLRHPAVDVVVAHVVADAIGAPAQRQFRQVAGAQHEAVVLIGQAEQIVGAQARLHVLEGDVVHRLAVREGVADVAQHLFGGGANVDLGPRHAQRRHQRPGVGLGAFRRGEPRHGEGQNARARQLQPVKSATGDQQGLRRIQPSRNADHQGLRPRRRHPPHQPLDLDVEGLETVLIQTRGVVRHEGEAVQRTDQGVGRPLPRLERNHRRGLALDPGAVGEGAVAQAVQTDAVHVHVGDRQMAMRREPLALGQPRAQLVNGRLTVPRQIRGALAPARGGEDIGRQGARRLAGAQQGALVGLADDDVGGRQVAQDARACERRPRRRRQRRPEVLADLDGEDEARPVGRLKDQARGEIDARTVQDDSVLAAAGGGREPALLIIFAVVGQIGLGDHAQHLAPAQHDGAVEQGVAVADRRADHGDHARLVRDLGQARDLALDLFQQGRLQVQVVDGRAQALCGPVRRRERLGQDDDAGQDRLGPDRQGRQGDDRRRRHVPRRRGRAARDLGRPGGRPFRKPPRRRRRRRPGLRRLRQGQGRGLRRRPDRHRRAPAEQVHPDGRTAENRARVEEGRCGRPARNPAGAGRHRRPQCAGAGKDFRPHRLCLGRGDDQAGRHRARRRPGAGGPGLRRPDQADRRRRRGRGPATFRRPRVFPIAEQTSAMDPAGRRLRRPGRLHGRLFHHPRHDQGDVGAGHRLDDRPGRRLRAGAAPGAHAPDHRRLRPGVRRPDHRHRRRPVREAEADGAERPAGRRPAGLAAAEEISVQSPAGLGHQVGQAGEDQGRAGGIAQPPDAPGAAAGAGHLRRRSRAGRVNPAPVRRAGGRGRPLRPDPDRSGPAGTRTLGAGRPRQGRSPVAGGRGRPHRRPPARRGRRQADHGPAAQIQARQFPGPALQPLRRRRRRPGTSPRRGQGSEESRQGSQEGGKGRAQRRRPGQEEEKGRDRSRFRSTADRRCSRCRRGPAQGRR